VNPEDHLPPDPASVEEDCEAIWRELEQTIIQSQQMLSHEQALIESRIIAAHEHTSDEILRAEQEAADAMREQLRVLSTLRPQLPPVMLTPDGRVDFTYIFGRLVTGGACSLDAVDNMPFPRAVQLFEYWETHPPVHETLVRISEHLSTILGRGADEKGVSGAVRKSVKRKQPFRDDPMLPQKLLIRQLMDEGLSHRQICRRLADSPRPPHAAWRDLPWPEAFKRHPNSVRAWISKALV
jgi:hypothetical protein